MKNLEKRVQKLEDRVGIGGVEIMILYRTVLTKDDLDCTFPEKTHTYVTIRGLSCCPIQYRLYCAITRN